MEGWKCGRLERVSQGSAGLISPGHLTHGHTRVDATCKVARYPLCVELCDRLLLVCACHTVGFGEVLCGTYGTSVGGNLKATWICRFVQPSKKWATAPCIHSASKRQNARKFVPNNRNCGSRGRAGGFLNCPISNASHVSIRGWVYSTHQKEGWKHRSQQSRVFLTITSGHLSPATANHV